MPAPAGCCLGKTDGPKQPIASMFAGCVLVAVESANIDPSPNGVEGLAIDPKVLDGAAELQNTFDEAIPKDEAGVDPNTPAAVF